VGTEAVSHRPSEKEGFSQASSDAMVFRVFDGKKAGITEH
jgi:hypothetical protein